MQQYLVKGKAVAVDDELRQERWQQDGQNRSKVGVVANYVQLLGQNEKPQQEENHNNQDIDW
jgi:single-strand DNA-binding protein